jgi:hypothetical protein
LEVDDEHEDYVQKKDLVSDNTTITSSPMKTQGNTQGTDINSSNNKFLIKLKKH